MKKIQLKHTIAIEEESLVKGLKSISKYFKQLAKKEKKNQKKYKYIRKIAEGEIQIKITATQK
jgi:hypothetical protein